MFFPNISGLRNGFNETEHRFSLVLTDADGQIIAETQNGVTERTFIRSSLKPFQAFVSLENSTIDVTDEELAIMIASHAGAAEQQQWVKSILQKAHCGEADLQCGSHLPFDKATAEKLICAHLSPSSLHHNCSGKHAGMLLACVSQGWDKTTYKQARHPYQLRLLELLETLCPSEQYDIAVDGCGVPVYNMSLKTMGMLYAQLVFRLQFQRIVRVMQQFPALIGDIQRLDSLLMSVTQGRLIAKVGADGLLLMANTETQQGLAVKLWDGQNAIRDKIVVAILQRQGWITLDEKAALITQRPNLSLNRLNNQNDIIGEYRIGF